ncbi:MAG: dockerin type I domain-containing protein [Oscillospiraceae bacterium]
MNIKKIIAVITASAVLTASLVTTAFAVTDIGKPCYSKIMYKWVEEQIINKDVTANYKNHAKDGWTTPDVLELINFDEDVQEDIKKATVINVSLGGNELIQFLLNQCCKALEIPFTGNAYGDIQKEIEKIGVMGALGKILKRIQSDEMFVELTQVVQTYEANCKKLIDEIDKLNPGVKIIFTTIPRPTHSDTIGQLFDLVIDRRFLKPTGDYNTVEFFNQLTFNKVIVEKFGIDEGKYNVEIVDSFKYFFENASDENPLTGAKIDFSNIENSTFDPHPNVKGHEEIAKLNLPIYEKLLEDFLKPKYVLGDVNNDKKINTLDALAILKFCAKMETLTEIQLKAADYNNDTKVNTLDALSILKYIVTL